MSKIGRIVVETPFNFNVYRCEMLGTADSSGPAIHKRRIRVRMLSDGRVPGQKRHKAGDIIKVHPSLVRAEE